MTEPTPRPADTPDAADRRRISSDALDRTLFVEAGAGSGKTTQLVERICNLVVDHGVPLPSIAAITFTEAAAAELQSRIRVRFEQRAENSTDPHERERCCAALADADLAAISTLHGFAARILGEFALAAGLPPRVRVLDEVSSQLAAEERWRAFVNDLHAADEHHELLVRAALLDIPVESAGHRRPSLQQVAEQLNDNWDLLRNVGPAKLAPLAPIDYTPLRRALGHLQLRRAECSDPADLLHVRMVEVGAAAEAVLEVPEELRLGKLRVRGRWSVGRGGKKGNWPDLDVAKEAIRQLDAAATMIRDSATDEVLRHFVVLVARQVLDAAEARRRDGGLEFHDLLVLARDMLRTSSEVRDALHRRYRHLLLDEFQDTDPIQIDLATLIAAAFDSSSSLPAWDRLEVPEGSLFFVGDPKQSIYRFRRADIGLFLQARDRFATGHGAARLTTNFRTVEPVLDLVNRIFSAVMADEIPGKQPAYEALTPWRRADSGGDHRPVLFGGPHPDPKVRADVLREAEAAGVARIAASILAEPERWPVYDAGEERWRAARAADVTVLLPARTSLPFLRRALDERRVPYRLATGTLVYNTQEVRDLLAVLAAVDDPTDEVSVVAALRSPLYACSDVDLYTWRRDGGPWALRHDPPASLAALDHPVGQALAHLHSLWRQRWWMTPSTLLSRVVRDRQAMLLAFGTERPADVWRRVRFLVDQARAFEHSGGGDLRAFIEWARLQGSDEARVHEPLLPETDEAAVQIMTIHGAKGLEFPITILSGLTTVPGNAPGGLSLLWDDDGQPELKLNAQVQTARHQLRADIEAEFDAHEKLRLLYVAATRARDHLIVSTHHKRNGPSSFAKQVWDTVAGFDSDGWRSLDDHDAGAAPAGETPAGAVPTGAVPAGAVPAEAISGDVDEALAERRRWQAERVSLVDRFANPRVVSATAVARQVRAGSPHEGSGLDDDDDDHADAPDDRPIPQRQGRTGSAVGRAVHDTMQLLDLRAPRHLSEVVAQRCAAEGIDELAGLVEAMVRSALASPAVTLAATYPHHKELYVSAPAQGGVIEGYIDLLVDTPDGLVVVDYKTDAAATEADIEAKLDAYELQAASYAVALETVVGRPVAECRFVFCRPTGPVERRVRDLPAARAEVRAALARAGAGLSVAPPVDAGLGT